MGASRGATDIAPIGRRGSPKPCSIDSIDCRREVTFQPLIGSQSSSLYSAFTQILYAVVVAQSFTFLVQDSWYRPWINEPSQHVFELAVLLLVYTLVVIIVGFSTIHL